MPVDLSYAALNDELALQLVGKSVATVDGGLALTATSVKMMADGDRLRVALGFEAKENHVFGARFRGEVHLRGRPALEVERQHLTFKDVVVTAESQEALNAGGVLAKLIGPLAEAQIAKKASIDLSREAARARGKAEAALRSATALGIRPTCRRIFPAWRAGAADQATGDKSHLA